MRAKRLIAMIAVVFLTSLGLSYQMIPTKINMDVDIIAVNEAVKTVEREWGHLDRGNFSAIQQPFVVIDINGRVLYQSAGGLSLTLNEAIKNRDTIVDVTVKYRPVGKLLLHNDYKAAVRHDQQNLMLIIIVAFAIILLLCILYLLYINHSVFRPFKRLKSFALNVARGNLDIPLKMDKHNSFGAFTESFDLMREELAAARQSEYEANRSKKELVASLSHDIRTPVASIKAVSELMLMRAADEKAVRQLNTIYSKAEQINLLVTDMFHATLEELNELKVIVAEELSLVLDGIIAEANDHDQIRCTPIPDCMLMMDAARLQQVFDNILSNAYKYAGSAVTIASALTPTHLELHIMDYGSGVQEDELPLLFNKFFRGSNAAGRQGAGLGLFISSYLMQRMRGDISCHNREDGFTVTLRVRLAGAK